MAKKAKPKDKPEAAPASPPPAAAAPTAEPVAEKKSKRTPWLNSKSGAPLIQKYAERAESFLTAMADGVIEDKELTDQEARLVTLMEEIEPQLSDALHEKMTELLCELTVYDMMQMFQTLHAERPTTRFQG